MVGSRPSFDVVMCPLCILVATLLPAHGDALLVFVKKSSNRGARRSRFLFLRAQLFYRALFSSPSSCYRLHALLPLVSLLECRGRMVAKLTPPRRSSFAHPFISPVARSLNCCSVVKEVGKPSDFLKNVVGKTVAVRLHSGIDYRGS